MSQQLPLDGLPPLPPERKRGRPTKAAAKAHAETINKAVRAGRRTGMKRAMQRAEVAGDHAERHVDGWKARACTLALEYGRTVGSGGFPMEAARVYAEANGLPDPPDKRAWGTIATILKFAKEPGMRIEKCGSTTDAYGSPKPLWRIV